MAQFHPLTVTNIEKTIRDAVVVTLQPADGFDFIQGQYLTFRRQFGEQELRRSYSICSAKDDDLLQVGIKRVSGGAFSTWANSELAVGDVIEAMPPMGKFFAKSDAVAPHYLAFAGGSGITPVLSILRTGLEDEPNARFTLVYANRNPNTIMFREELEDLKNRHMGRFNVIHILEGDSQEIDLFQGRVDDEKCAALVVKCGLSSFPQKPACWKRHLPTTSTHLLPVRPACAPPAKPRSSRERWKWSKTTPLKTTKLTQALC